MNKRGSLFLGVVIAVVVFFFGVLFIPFITDDITTFRTNLDCTNATGISDGTKLTCLAGDLVVPYLIWFFCSLAIGYIIGSSV